jgi:hypothetical protein
MSLVTESDSLAIVVPMHMLSKYFGSNFGACVALLCPLIDQILQFQEYWTNYPPLGVKYSPSLRQSAAADLAQLPLQQ